MGDDGMMGMENLGDIGMEVEGYRLLGWKGFLEEFGFLRTSKNWENLCLNHVLCE